MSGSVALSLALQLAFSTLTLAFGAIGVRVAPRPPRSAREEAWFLSGVAFTVIGAVATVMAILAVPVMMVGKDAAVYRAFITVSPPLNDARGFVVLWLAAALGALVARRRPVRRRWAVWATFAATAAAGVALGVRGGPFTGPEHYAVMALTGSATCIALFAVLYAALVRDAIDWLLWATLAIYAAREVLSSSLQSALTWAGEENAWDPGPRMIFGLGIGSLCLMLACAARRLALARAGRDAPALMERLRS